MVLEAWRNGSREIQIKIEKRYGREVIERSLADHTNIFCLPIEHLQEVRKQWESGDPETRKDFGTSLRKEESDPSCWREL